MKFAVLSLGTFCSLTPGSFGSSQTRSLAEIQNRGGTGSVFPSDGDGRRRGESGGKRRGDRELPLGGRRSSGGGRSWALHGGRWPGVELGGGGASLATLGGRSRTEELRWGETKLVEGSIWGGTGRDGGSTELRRRPAMVAAALVSWARERLGSALYRQGRRERSSWGRVCWGGRCWGRRARPWQLGRPWWSPWRAQEGWGARGELLWRQERVGL